MSPIPPSGIHSEEISYVKSQLCELLSILIKKHSSITATAIIQYNMLRSLVKLFSCKETFLYLDIIRLFRSIIGIKDRNILNIIVEENIFAPIIEKFLLVKYKKNLLNSAILELFQYIVTNNIRILISDIYSKYYYKLKNITYVTTFGQLEQKYLHEKENIPNQISEKKKLTLKSKTPKSNQSKKKEVNNDSIKVPSLKRKRENDELETNRIIKRKRSTKV